MDVSVFSLEKYYTLCYHKENPIFIDHDGKYWEFINYKLTSCKRPNVCLKHVRENFENNWWKLKTKVLVQSFYSHVYITFGEYTSETFLNRKYYPTTQIAPYNKSVIVLVNNESSSTIILLKSKNVY